MDDEIDEMDIFIYKYKYKYKSVSSNPRARRVRWGISYVRHVTLLACLVSCARVAGGLLFLTSLPRHIIRVLSTRRKSMNFRACFCGSMPSDAASAGTAVAPDYPVGQHPAVLVSESRPAL